MNKEQPSIANNLESEKQNESVNTKAVCKWTRAFDQHFNISCESGNRGNGNFKGKKHGAKWEFIFCPYCGRRIELIDSR